MVAARILVVLGVLLAVLSLLAVYIRFQGPRQKVMLPG
jgi:hypothetical protein